MVAQTTRMLLSGKFIFIIPVLEIILTLLGLRRGRKEVVAQTTRKLSSGKCIQSLLYSRHC